MCPVTLFTHIKFLGGIVVYLVTPRIPIKALEVLAVFSVTPCSHIKALGTIAVCP